MAKKKTRKEPRRPRTTRPEVSPTEQEEGWTEALRRLDREAAANGVKPFEGRPTRPRFTDKEVRDLLDTHKFVREQDAAARRRRERKTRAS